MRANPADDPVLRRFRAALDAIYGDRIRRVVLFGSRARGDARADSDYDVAVFLDAVEDHWAERMRLADLSVEMIDETGAMVDGKVFASVVAGNGSALMFEIKRDGLEL